jgi:hypothetical protein
MLAVLITWNNSGYVKVEVNGLFACVRKPDSVCN